METANIPPEIRKDAETVIRALMEKQPIDPEVAQRVQERAKKISERIFNEHGVADVGVPAIRELRGELPE